MKKVLLAVVITGVLGFAAITQGAVQATSTSMTISASVQGKASFSTEPPAVLDLGALDPSTAAPAGGTGLASFGVKVSKGQAYTITVSGAASPASRNLSDTAPTPDAIPYTLTVGNASNTGNGFGNPITHTIDISIPYAGFQNAPVGVYSDSVTFEVNF